MSSTGFLSVWVVLSVLVSGLGISHAQAQSRVLTWPGKAQSPESVPPSQLPPEPARSERVVEAVARPVDPVPQTEMPEVRNYPVPVSVPAPMPIAAPVVPTPAAPPIRTAPLPSDFGQSPRPGARIAAEPKPSAPVQVQAAPVAPAKPVAPPTVTAAAPVPVPAPPTASVPVTPADAPYQIPPTSKYAGRVATAPAPAQAAGQNPVAANAQALAEQMPTQASGNGFVPGQQATNPETQRPRFYSLHRQYGLVPDPSPHTATPDPRSSVSKE